MQPYIKLYLDSLNSENSKKAVIKNLRAIFSRISPFTPLTDQVAVDFCWHKLPLSEYSKLKSDLLNEAKSSSYINTLMTILRQVLSWALVDGKISGKSLEDIKHVIKSVSSNKKRQVEQSYDDDEVDLNWLIGQSDNLSNISNEKGSKSLDTNTVERLIKSIGKITPKGMRNRAIFMCMSHGGLRREEVSQLRLQDLYFSKTPGDSFIKVIGKGAKLRHVPMSTPLYDALLAWASFVVKTENRKKSSFFFRKVNTVHKVLNDGLTNNGIYQIIRKTGDDEGVVNLHPHKLRHFFATRLLLNGCDIFEVAKFLGHSNIETTRHYDDRGFDTLQKAIGNLAC